MTVIFFMEDTISSLSHLVKMGRVSRREQCIQNNRKYRKRKWKELEYLKKMKKFFKENNFESYQNFVHQHMQERRS